MPVRPRKIPSYRLHKPTGQAVVRLDGRDYYLGRHGSDSSHGRKCCWAERSSIAQPPALLIGPGPEVFRSKSRFAVA